MREMRETTPAPNQVTEASNSQKTLHWLQTSLGEVRGEIAELNRALNVSRQLHERQDTHGQLELAKSDVSALQTLAAEAKAERRQINQSIGELSDDVHRLALANQRIERIESDVSTSTLHLARLHACRPAPADIVTLFLFICWFTQPRHQ